MTGKTINKDQVTADNTEPSVKFYRDLSDEEKQQLRDQEINSYLEMIAIIVESPIVKKYLDQKTERDRFSDFKKLFIAYRGNHDFSMKPATELCEIVLSDLAHLNEFIGYFPEESPYLHDTD